MFIERIGHTEIHVNGRTHAAVLVDRDTGDVETYATPRAAREAALERVDLVDQLAAGLGWRN